MEPSLADMSTCAGAERNSWLCVRACVCVYVLKKKLWNWSRFVFAQSLLFASGADTLLQLQFYGVTFVYFMRCTDLLVHMTHIQIVKHG